MSFIIQWKEDHTAIGSIFVLVFFSPPTISEFSERQKWNQHSQRIGKRLSESQIVYMLLPSTEPDLLLSINKDLLNECIGKESRAFPMN